MSLHNAIQLAAQRRLTARARFIPDERPSFNENAEILYLTGISSADDRSVTAKIEYNSRPHYRLC
jgi:hypothetical protein